MIFVVHYATRYVWYIVVILIAYCAVYVRPGVCFQHVSRAFIWYLVIDLILRNLRGQWSLSVS